ncbi:MAG: phosphodiester glycosidase family protein [Acidobacteriota bacterium]
MNWSTVDMFVRFRIPVLFLFVLFVFGVNLRAQEFKTVHDGVEYAELTREISGLPVKINLLRLDLRKIRLDVVHAMNAAIGMEKTSFIAGRHKAVAAINSGFFRLDKSIFAGDAVGTLMIDGELLSESTNNRIALKILNQKKATAVSIERSVINPWFGFGDLHSQIKLAGVDRESKPGEFILYGPDFGPATPVAAKGTLVAITGCKRAVKAGLVFVECRHAAVANANDQMLIPRDGYLISLGLAESKEKKLLLNDLNFYLLSKSAKSRYYIRFENELSRLPNVEQDVVAGVPLLIRDGKIDVTWEQEKSSKSFVETRHPRTAVAKLKDGKFLMITVDGRSESSGGIGLYDLANLLLEFGATDAMNLDGGGSTTMFLDGKVVNHPSDKEGERKVSDALIVTLRKK